MDQREIYSLRQVVELTGLSEFTLRGWETRYAAFRPGRTDTGRREYTAKDLRRAILLRELTKRGKRIGDIAALSTAKLNAFLESADRAEASDETPSEVVEALRLASLQRWEELEKFLCKLAHRRSPLALALEFVAPLMSGMSGLADAGRLSISQEHVLSSMTKDLLHSLRRRADLPKEDAPRVLIAAPEGDFHELGILLSQLLLGLHGYRTLFLGPNSPKEDICETAVLFRASHILLGATVRRAESGREPLPAIVHFLDAHLPPDVTLWLGGREGARFGGNLNRPHMVFGSIAAFEARLGFVRGDVKK